MVVKPVVAYIVLQLHLQLHNHEKHQIVDHICIIYMITSVKILYKFIYSSYEFLTHVTTQAKLKS